MQDSILPQQKVIEMVLKNLFDYLQRTIDIGLFYFEESKSELIGYADAEYLSDPYKLSIKKLFVYIWRHNNILAINEANVGNDFFKSCIYKSTP